MATKTELKNALDEGYSKKIGEINDLWNFLEELQERKGYYGFTVNGPYGINSSIDKTIGRLSDQLDEKGWSAFWLVAVNNEESFNFLRYGTVKLEDTIYRLGKVKSKKISSSKVANETEEV